MAREAREAQGEDWDAAPYVSSDEEEEEEGGQQTATVAQVYRTDTLLVICSQLARDCFAQALQT